MVASKPNPNSNSNPNLYPTKPTQPSEEMPKTVFCCCFIVQKYIAVQVFNQVCALLKRNQLAFNQPVGVEKACNGVWESGL